MSEDGSLIAYQANGDLKTATKVILNVETGKKQKVTCGKGQCICPLGFVRSDFVYGVAKTEDIGNTYLERQPSQCTNWRSGIKKEK